MLRILSPLNPSPSAGFETVNLESNGKHNSHYITEDNQALLKDLLSYLWLTARLKLKTKV
jgi:hypothetical protein